MSEIIDFESAVEAKQHVIKQGMKRTVSVQTIAEETGFSEIEVKQILVSFCIPVLDEKAKEYETEYNQPTAVAKLVASLKKHNDFNLACEEAGVSKIRGRRLLEDAGENKLIPKTKKAAKGKFDTREELEHNVIEMYKKDSHVGRVSELCDISPLTAIRILALEGLVKTKNKQILKEIELKKKAEGRA